MDRVCSFVLGDILTCRRLAKLQELRFDQILQVWWNFISVADSMILVDIIIWSGRHIVMS